jgi:ribonuclease VapC
MKSTTSGGAELVFVDTSVIVSMMLEEPQAEALGERLAAAAERITSPLVILEAGMVLSSRMKVEPDLAETRIRNLLDQFAIAIVPIDDGCATLAIKAFTRFGKGRGHKAQLNMSDCLSYAVASQHSVPMLYTGTDFAATDMG